MELNKALGIFKININKNDTNKSKKELKNKYKELALRMHPDKCAEPDAAEKFNQLQEAYTIVYRYIREIGSSKNKTFEELVDIYQQEQSKVVPNNTKMFSNTDFENTKVKTVYEEAKKDYTPLVVQLPTKKIKEKDFDKEFLKVQKQIGKELVNRDQLVVYKSSTPFAYSEMYSDAEHFDYNKDKIKDFSSKTYTDYNMAYTHYNNLTAQVMFNPTVIGKKKSNNRTK
jgi:hypothetical protein